MSAEQSDQWHREEGEWGSLPLEPCRFCRRQGGVRFRSSDHPLDLFAPQVVRCEFCHAVWEADSSNA